MKVMFIHSQCENGGISRIVFSICDLLKEQGSEGMFAFSRGFVPEGKQQVCHMFGNKYEIYLHMLASRLFDSHGLWSKQATKELITYIEKYEPDIIHLNNVHGYYLDIIEFFAYLKSKNIPIVWTMHDCWAVTGHCSHFEYYNCEKWKYGCKNCEHRDVYPKSWFISKAERNYREKKRSFEGLNRVQIVVPSEWLYGIIKESYLKNYPCTVINNGINLNVFNVKNSIPELATELNDKRIILAVASVWTSGKGYKDIIKLSGMIDKKEFALVVVGVTEKQKEELKHFGVYSILHTKNVDELAEWYSIASVFINPTYEDTFPTVNIEALACGTPVVTYRTGGSPEIITTHCGIVVEKGNIYQLHEAVTKIEKKPVECRRVAERYDANKKFKEYIRLYEDLVHKEGNFQ